MAVRTVVGYARAPMNTAAFWAATTQNLPKGLVVFDSTTNKAKVGDGTKTWTQLSYFVDEVFTSAYKVLLDSFNAANKLLKLDGDGLVPVANIPVQFQNAFVFKANIAARDAIPVGERATAPVFVFDATGDNTVNAGAAVYVWDTTNSVWIKVYEQESLDVSLAGALLDTDTIILDGGDGTLFN